MIIRTGPGCEGTVGVGVPSGPMAWVSVLVMMDGSLEVVVMGSSDVCIVGALVDDKGPSCVEDDAAFTSSVEGIVFLSSADGVEVENVEVMGVVVGIETSFRRPASCDPAPVDFEPSRSVISIFLLEGEVVEGLFCVCVCSSPAPVDCVKDAIGR